MALPFLAALGGGGGLSASSSASSGPTSQGNSGVSVGGINTGSQAGALPQWLMIAAVAVVAVLVLRRR